MRNKLYDILMVDDDSNNLQLGINILKQNPNYNVIFATSGAMALKQVAEYDFDLILLDIMMDPMDGYEVCKTLKKDAKVSHIPIIFLTAQNDEDSIVKGFELGAVDFITKPFFAHELLARVKTHVELKTLQEKLQKDLDIKNNLLLQQNKMASMGEMLENIVYQWRKPLDMITTLSSGAKVQKEMGIPLSEIEEMDMLDNITTSAEDLAKTVEDFRIFFENKERTLSQVDMIVDTTLNLITSDYFRHNIKVIKNIDVIELTEYENELIQVLMNIISNSKDALRDIQGEKILQIDAHKENNDIVLVIKDNGNGIADNIIGKVFNLYISTKDEKEGAGLGLYMTKNIINKYFKGSITVANTTFKVDDLECYGAEFTIRLPNSQI